MILNQILTRCILYHKACLLPHLPRQKILRWGIKYPLRKLETKISRNQKLSEGVETFPSFVIGEPQIKIAITKLAEGHPLSDNKYVEEIKIIKQRICTG